MEPQLETFDPWARKRPAPKRETVTLPDSGLTLELVQLDTLRSSAAIDEANSLIAAHIAGEDAQPLILGGETIELNELIVRELCYIRQMFPREQRPFFPWLLGLSLNYPDDYRQIVDVAMRLNGDIRKNSRMGTAPSTSGA